MPFLLSCSTVSSSGCGSPEGQSWAGSFSQSGPSHHLDCISWWTVHPLLGRSAGFMTPGTCRQDSFEVRFRISCTRFYTIQSINADESLQKNCTIYFCSSSFTIDVANLVHILVANSSSLGIVTVLTGATRNLVWNSCTCTQELYSKRMKTAAACAILLASQNVCNEKLNTRSDTPINHLGILTSCRRLRSLTDLAKD